MFIVFDVFLFYSCYRGDDYVRFGRSGVRFWKCDVGDVVFIVVLEFVGVIYRLVRLFKFGSFLSDLVIDV